MLKLWSADAAGREGGQDVDMERKVAYFFFDISRKIENEKLEQLKSFRFREKNVGTFSFVT